MGTIESFSMSKKKCQIGFLWLEKVSPPPVVQLVYGYIFVKPIIGKVTFKIALTE